MKNADPINEVILVPDAASGLLPYSMCTGSDGSRQFVDKYAISIRPRLSKSDLEKPSREFSPQMRCLVLADPHNYHDPRPCTVAEGRIVQSFFRHTTLLDQERATLAAVADQLEQTEIWHFACHGTFGTDDPMTSRLLLSGSDSLSARSLIHEYFPPPPSLVVLSACSTGRYATDNLPNEYMGLVTAFLQKGARNVVASLWDVPDLATFFLMERFYYNLITLALPPPEALRRSQCWLRDVTAKVLRADVQAWKSAKRLPTEQSDYMFSCLSDIDEHSVPFANPYHWAAWVVYKQ